MKNLLTILTVILTFYFQNITNGQNLKTSDQKTDFNVFDKQNDLVYPNNIVKTQLYDRSNNILKNKYPSTNNSLEEPALFPHQKEYIEYREAFPVIAENGHLMMIWAEWNNLYFSSNQDNEHSWSEPELILSENEDCVSLTGLCTQSGRIIVIWQSNFGGLKLVYSNNNGTSWSELQTVTNDGNDRHAALTQSLDGTLWLCYCRNNEGTSWDIYYRTSTNDGIYWSTEKTLATSSSPEIFGTIVSGDASTLLAYYSVSNGNWDIYMKESSNNGASWSEPMPFLNTEKDEIRPRALLGDDNVLWLVYYKMLPLPVLPIGDQYDIYYMQSNNGGSSWTTSEQFTHYVGYDGFHNIVLLDNKPFISFCSERFSSFFELVQIWYGLIGTTQDNNPPPAILDCAINDTIDESTIDIHAFVDDETGVNDVKLFYSLNDVPANPVQMYDDGLHGDWSANDNVWAGQIGPFNNPGDVIYYGTIITDIDANTVNINCGEFRKNLVHDSGNILLDFWTDSRLAGGLQGTNCYWPRENGNDYLYLGGFWVGTDCLGEPRVMEKQYDNSDWYRTLNAQVTLQPGISDQDGSVIYDDDRSSTESIGLKVNQESFQWTENSRDDFIIFRYTITNKGTNGDLSNLYASLWLDPDVGNYSDDLGEYDASRNLIYLYDSQGSPEGLVGLKLLGPSISPYSATIERCDENDIERFNYMTKGTTTIPTEPRDYNMLLTAQPFNLAVGASKSVTFGLVMGKNLQELQTHADTMQAIYNATIVGINESIISPIPLTFSLAQNYPNPFNPITRIKYQLAQLSQVDLSVYNLLGQKVTTLISEKQPAGYYYVKWNANDYASGVYLYRLKTDKGFVQTRKLVLLK